MKKKNILHISLCLLTVLFLSIHGIQMISHYLKITPLSGVTLATKKAELNDSTWLHHTYQTSTDAYLQENYGFRPWYIRLYNQIRFSLFNQYNTNYRLGKNGVLFEKHFIEKYYGKHTVNKKNIQTTIGKLSQIRDSLNAHNKEIILVFAPGKATYYTDFIAARDQRVKESNTYENHIEVLKESTIPYIDINQWFLNAKDTTKIPLFPRTGTHWSCYGAYIAYDSIINFIAHQLNHPMGSLSIAKPHKTLDLKPVDYDIESGLNLIFPLTRDSLAYPKIRVNSTDSTFKPRAIIISDSFFWNLYNLGIDKKFFTDLKFWYYNSSIFPESFNSQLYTKDIDLKEQIDNHDIFIVMACPATMNDLGWGFIQNTYAAVVDKTYQPNFNKKFNRLVTEYATKIRNSKTWYNQIKQKAIARKLPLDTMLLYDARWMAKEKLKTEGVLF